MAYFGIPGCRIVPRSYSRQYHEGAGEAYAFFADGGSVSVVEGTTVHEADGDVSACGPADMYLIAEPDGDHVVLELSA